MRKVLVCIYGLAMAALTITGCGGGGGDSYNPPPSTPAKQTVEKYPVSGTLADPDGLTISGTVALSATNAGGAVSLYSDKTGGTLVTSLSVSADGLISFYVADTAVLPVTVKAVATKTGWVSSSTTFSVTASGLSTFTIKMVDASSTTTAGVASGTSSAAAGSAQTATVSTADPTKTSASVVIPATTFTDSANTSLSGTVTTVATSFAPPTITNPVFTDANLNCNPAAVPDDPNCIVATSALESFPGGMADASGYFVTAGFISVSAVDTAGKDAKSSSAPFTIHLDIPAGTYNPITDAAVAVGDSIPVWTYNETEAVWKEEVDAGNNPISGTVQQDANGLFVLHTTNHFSFWNLGWKKAGCSGTLNLTGDAVAMQLILNATPAKGGKLLTAVKPAGDATVNATQIPTGLLDIVLTDPLKKTLATLKKVDWCLAPLQTITMNYTAPVTKKPVPITVKVQESCIQAPTVTRPVPSVITNVKDNNNKILVSTGTTDITGTYIHNLVPQKYFVSAYNRTTLKYDTKPMITVVAATPQTIVFDQPVTCTSSGTSGGSPLYGF